MDIVIVCSYLEKLAFGMIGFALIYIAYVDYKLKRSIGEIRLARAQMKEDEARAALESQRTSEKRSTK